MAETGTLIKLAGDTYFIQPGGWKEDPQPINSSGRGLTGKVLKQETGLWNILYTAQLQCTYAQVLALRKLNAQRTPPFNLMDLVTPEGLGWHPGTGSDTEKDKYGTGVFIEGMSVVSDNNSGWDASATFTVTLTLLVNAATNPVW